MSSMTGIVNPVNTWYLSNGSTADGMSTRYDVNPTALYSFCNAVVSEFGTLRVESKAEKDKLFNVISRHELEMNRMTDLIREINAKYVEHQEFFKWMIETNNPIYQEYLRHTTVLQIMKASQEKEAKE